ncbi:hypothetical protein BKA56DRAFT_596194 [Ilyonectria sp. MPI-CAGE-AT-0026]|nr:hypothetical protein BKA56DRAFT_596194 [Ilyonectria sp. MPI-CAGE-AT-0026]
MRLQDMLNPQEPDCEDVNEAELQTESNFGLDALCVAPAIAQVKQLSKQASDELHQQACQETNESGNMQFFIRTDTHDKIFSYFNRGQGSCIMRVIQRLCNVNATRREFKPAVLTSGAILKTNQNQVMVLIPLGQCETSGGPLKQTVSPATGEISQSPSIALATGEPEQTRRHLQKIQSKPVLSYFLSEYKCLPLTWEIGTYVIIPRNSGITVQSGTACTLLVSYTWDE